ncbi:hypothetical protein lerEdw1_005724 [Lerista edwardsae]|nr:hypothetical protein lerEdw1_005729 [Lerista edwardsae]KAJ6650607.1 hypothetical protein lerEdw1_005724 [Lerista edwardsae]
MLLRLRTCARLTSAVNVIPLPSRCPSDGTRCTVSGWGTTSTPQVQLPPRMQCADVNIVPRAECNRAYYGAISTYMLCAGVPQGGVDSCQVREGFGDETNLPGGISVGTSKGRQWVLENSQMFLHVSYNCDKYLTALQILPGISTKLAVSLLWT